MTPEKKQSWSGLLWPFIFLRVGWAKEDKFNKWLPGRHNSYAVHSYVVDEDEDNIPNYNGDQAITLKEIGKKNDSKDKIWN